MYSVSENEMFRFNTRIQLKNKQKYHTVRTFPQYNRKIVETEA